MAARTGVPIGISATPARLVEPLIVQTIVPGDSSVPSERNQSGPLAMIPGTFAIVSTLLTRAGGASVSPAIRTGAASPLSLTASASPATTSMTPRRHGGAMRGNGGRPSTASSNAVSSP